MWAFFPGALAFVGSALYLFLRIRPKKSITSLPDVDRGRQSLPVKGEPGVYKCGLITSEDQNVVETIFPDVTTLWEAFLHGLEASADGSCLGTRGSDGKYTFRKYSEVHKESQNVASALAGELHLKKGEKFGIYAQNRPEWTITALAAMQQSVTVVPLYDTLGADAAAFIVSQTEISAVLVDTLTKARNLSSKKTTMPTLKTIIMVKKEDVTKEAVEEMKSVGINLVPYSDLVEQGARNPQPANPPSRDDIYIICYTSGTTGRPKGVILTHKNVIANMSGWIYMCNRLIPDTVNPSTVALSYLPLSHMMEQVCHWTLLMYGAQIGFYSGSIPRLTEDIQALRPTSILAVPRILNRLYSGIQTQVQSGSFITKLIYNIAHAKKLELLIQGINTKDSIWDKIVFDKVQKQLGGNVTLLVTGSAPLSEEVLQTCRLALGTEIIEGYGQTECTAIATLGWPGDWTGGHCGGVAACSNIKLADVPELNYYAKEGRGEIMIRGPNVTQGYYKDPERTAELFDEQGFIHSGDIGELQPNGTFKIIDRRKHIFKLAQGEYVAPEKIENVYIRSPVLQQVFVDGDSLERWLIAVVVPQPKIMEEWNAEHGVAGRSLEEIYRDKKAQEYVLSQLHEIGKENKLNSIEQVKRVYLEAEPFSVENNLLTPTLKAKRPQLRQKYKDIMKSIYNENRNL